MRRARFRLSYECPAAEPLALILALGEMPDEGACCGRDCYRALASGWSVTAHRSRHRKGSLFAALAASLKCPSLMSAREAAPTSTPADVSGSFSRTLEIRSGKLVRAKSFKAHHAASRDGRNPSTEYASRQEAPPICSPLTKQVQNIATQTEIIRMRLRPLKPGHELPEIERRQLLDALTEHIGRGQRSTT